MLFIDLASMKYNSEANLWLAKRPLPKMKFCQIWNGSSLQFEINWEDWSNYKWVSKDSWKNWISTIM